MKVLFLTKFSEVENFLLNFTQKIHKALPLEVDVLHVVNSYPQVPLKLDGTIIDKCVDYDLSGLEKLQKEEQILAEEIKSANPFISSASVKIGDLRRIVKYLLTQKDYDFIFMGSHKTSLIEDWTHETTIDRILEQVDIPVLSIKCDQSHNVGIERIGIFHDFSSSEQPKKIESLSKLAKALGSEAHLFKFVKEPLSEEKRDACEKRMRAFATENELSNYQLHILSVKGSNEEELMTQHMVDEDLQLIAIPELHRKSVNWMFGKNLKSSIADHVLAPLLIY